jgi:Asp/Glu/hydantoin racemase
MCYDNQEEYHMKIKVGVIRVVTLQDPELLHSHGHLIESRFPDLIVESRCIQDQPEGIYNQETYMTAIPKILKLGQEMEQHGVSAIIVSCADDPGVRELRSHVKIPVIGAGSACACLALAFGTRIGTFGIRPQAPQVMKEILGEHLIVEAQPRGVKTTLDLLTEEGKQSAIETVSQLREKGFESIALACTGFSTIRLARDLERAGGMPVIDAIDAAGLFTWYLARDMRYYRQYSESLLPRQTPGVIEDSRSGRSEAETD